MIPLTENSKQTLSALQKVLRNKQVEHNVNLTALCKGVSSSMVFHWQMIILNMSIVTLIYFQRSPLSDATRHCAFNSLRGKI